MAAEGDAVAAPQGMPGSEEEVVAAGNKLVLQLHAAAKDGKMDELEEMLGKCPQLANTRDRDSQSSALHVAARSNQLSAVKLLLSKGANPLLPDKDGLTPLDHARVRHRKEVVDLLWQHIRADPPPLKQIGPLISALFEAPMQRSNLDWALAHYGAQKLLDAKGRDLRTPLHFAITNNDPDLIDELLDLGADAFVKDSEGVTPLDMAKQAGHTRMARAIANNMKVQLFAFVALALLFYIVRNHKDPQLAWYLGGVLYPSIRTGLCLTKATTTDALGEWLTYWAMAAPVLLLEFLVGKYAPKDFLAAATTATQGSASGLGSWLDLYVVVKMAATLYLLYPASRGARTIYKTLLAPGSRGAGGAKAADKGSKQN